MRVLRSHRHVAYSSQIAPLDPLVHATGALARDSVSDALQVARTSVRRLVWAVAGRLCQ